MNHLEIASRAFLDTLITVRKGETRLGERVRTVSSMEEIAGSGAAFVLLGIPEDVGVRANYGTGGARSGWEAALKALLNVQSGPQLDGEELLVLGAFIFEEWNGLPGSADAAALHGTAAGTGRENAWPVTGTDKLKALREMTAQIDGVVAPVIERVIAAGKIPLVVGGGHNNAYALIRGAAGAKGRGVNCINLDAHSDYRKMEGRHSGNGFRYAHKEGLLDRYAVIGLHENYNAADILDEMRQDPALHFSVYEDIFVRGEQSFYEAVQEGLKHVSGVPYGIELDLDCVEGILSSAMTPCGLTTLQARQYLTWCGTAAKPAWLHIAEGAAILDDGRSSGMTGKLIAYLLTDFMKAVSRFSD